MRAQQRLFVFFLAMLAGVAVHAQDPPATAAAPPPEERLSINGYFNVESDYMPSAYGLGDHNGSIDVDVFELLINYKGPDKFRISAALDWEHGADTEFTQGELTTGWLFMEYAHNDALKLRLGKFLTPFGVYNEIHGAKNLFLSRDEPRSTLKPQKIAKNGFRYAPKWMAGAAATGELPIGKGSLDYFVAAGNGDQLETNPYEADNNSKKATMARLQYSPNDDLLFGASAYHDYLTLAGKNDTGNLTSYGAHAHYTPGKWRLLYELAHGKQRLPGLALSGTETGQVAELGYVLGKYTPYVQWQGQNTSFGTTKEKAAAYIGGVDITMGRHFVYKVQDAYWTGSSANKKFDFPGRHYHEINMAFFYAF
jgi:hypothetical protein